MLSRQDFTVDGKALSDPDDDNYEDAYRNKLIYVIGESVDLSTHATTTAVVSYS